MSDIVFSMIHVCTVMPTAAEISSKLSILVLQISTEPEDSDGVSDEQ